MHLSPLQKLYKDLSPCLLSFYLNPLCIDPLVESDIFASPVNSRNLFNAQRWLRFNEIMQRVFRTIPNLENDAPLSEAQNYCDQTLMDGNNFKEDQPGV